MADLSLLSKATAAAGKVKAGAAPILDAVGTLSQLAEDTKAATDTVIGMVTGIPSMEEQLITGIGQAIDASNAAAAAANAARDAAQPYGNPTGQEGGSLFDDMKITIGLLRMGFGVIAPMGGVVSTEQVNQQVLDNWQAIQSTYAKVNGVEDFLVNLREGLIRYPLTLAGLAAYHSDVAEGKIFGNGLIVIYDDGQGLRVPTLNPDLLTIRSPSGDTVFSTLELIIDVMAGLYIFPRSG